MTGLEAVEINVHVRDVYIPGEDNSDEEEESRVR
jgi:uncharacterized alkaline shock family protein YloU